jgi:hypothetical protein
MLLPWGIHDDDVLTGSWSTNKADQPPSTHTLPSKSVSLNNQLS